jgi:hypothetical protein
MISESSIEATRTPGERVQALKTSSLPPLELPGLLVKSSQLLQANSTAYRVPTITVSVIDLVAKLERAAPVTEINTAFAIAANSSLAGILGYTDLPLVSSDFRGDSRSSIVDGLMTAVLSDENMVHIVGWYDNEWGYASRIADLANFISECEHSGQRLKRVGLVDREYIERALRMVSFAPEEPPL